MKSILVKSFILAILALELPASAQNYTNFWWTNLLGGSWSTAANWTNRSGTSVAPASSPTNILWFNQGSGFTATNNISGTFALNQLIIGATNMALSGNALMFTNNGSIIAYVTNTAGVGTEYITNSVVLATNIGFYGSGSAGITFNGPVATANSGTNSLSKNGTYTLTLAGTNVLGLITNNAGVFTFAASSTNSILRGPILVNGSATLNINGATHIFPDNLGAMNLQVGNNNGDRSLAVITTNFTFGGSIQVAAANVSTGAVYQTGGAVVSTYAAVGAGVLPIGAGGTGSYGYYRITGGTIGATEIDTAEASGANGLFDILGGTVTPTNYFHIGRGNGPQFATVNVWGGTLNAGAIANTIGMGTNIYQHVVATVNIGNGGFVTNNPVKTWNMTEGVGGDTNTLTLGAGGTLSTPQVINANPTPTNRVILNLVGGKLQANTNSADFLKNMDNSINGDANYVYLHDAGGVIDSQGFIVTNNASLVAASGGGIRSITINTSVSGYGVGYIAAPIVNITDPTGMGATAIAQINPANQTLTNILVTCPGVGYSATPTVVLVGGSATTPVALNSPIVGSSLGTGWLTKLGTGTLVMNSGNSTYTGNTTNSAGRLLMGVDNPFGNSYVGTLVMNGGTLGVNGGSWNLNDPILLQAVGNNFEEVGGTMTLRGTISGSGGLTKTGTNLLILLGNNTFTGGVTNQATNAIVINNSFALGYGSKTVYLIPANNQNIQPNLTLDNSSYGGNGNIILSNNISYLLSASGGAIINANGDNVINGNMAITSGGGYTLISVQGGTLVLNGSVTNINTGLRQFMVGGANNGTLNGPVLTSPYVMELLKQDIGTWTVNSTNTYNGGTYVNNGILTLGPTGSMTNSTPISIGSNGVFDVSAVGSFALAPGHTLTGDGLFNINGSLLVSSNATISPSAIDTNGIVYNPVGTLTINGNVILNGGTLIADIGDPTTAGGPLNDLLGITGSLTVNAPVVVNVGQFTAGSPQTGVPYPIITFTNSFVGSVSMFTNSQNFRGNVSFSLANNTIYMTFGAGTPGALTWHGDGVSNVWDLVTTPNWLNGGNPDTFRSGDTVTFDNTGSDNPFINLVGSAINPAAVIFNASQNYTLTGAGLTGYGPLEKDNSGVLTILNANSTVGGTTINGGVLLVGNGTSLAATPGPGPITNNSVLVFNYGGGDPTWSNQVSGAGAWYINSDGGNRSPVLTADNRGFTGTLYVTNNQRLEGYGTNYGNPSMIYVTNNGQIWPKASSDPNNALNQSITIAGMGCLIDAYPAYGALRLDGVTWSGPVTLSADASLGANANGSVSGNISGPYQLTFAQGAGHTITLSGNNTYASTHIINATAVAGSSTAFSPGPLAMAGGILQLNGYSFSFTNLNGTAGNITNASTAGQATITVGGDNTSTLFAGTLTDAGAQQLALDKIGGGELTLSGANNFSGGATIAAGTIAAVAGSALGNGPVTVNSGATLRVNTTVATNFNILKIGGLTINDGTTIAMSLGATNTAGDYIWVTNTLTLGTVGQVQFDFAFPKGQPLTNAYYPVISNAIASTPGLLPYFSIQGSRYTATFTNTGHLILVAFTGSSSNLVWTGNGLANAWTNSNTVFDWFNGVGKDYFGMGDSVTFNGVGATNPTVNVTGTVLPSAITVDTTLTPYTFTGAGNISGAASLTKIGTGTLTINSTNDYSGVTTISNGTVSVPTWAPSGSAGPLGAASSASGNLILAGGNLQYTGPSVLTDRGATLNASSSIEVTSAASGLTNNGVIAGVAGNTLTKTGPGTLVLGGASTFLGDTVIGNGTIRLGNAAGLGGLTGNLVATNGTLDVAGYVVGAKPVIVGGSGFNGQGAIDNSSPTTVYTFTKSVTMMADTIFNASGGRWDMRAANLICSNGQAFNLTKIGTNMMVVSANATVDTNLANINVLGGTFSVESLAGLGNPTNNMYVASNADFRVYTVTVPMVKNIYMTNGIFEVNGGGANYFAGTMNLVSGSNTIYFSTAATLTNAANITGSGSLAQLNNTSGILYLWGTNSYSGGTLVGAGTMYGTIYSLQGYITNNATVTLLSPGVNGTLNGLISGTGAVNVNSTNLTTINQPNNFTGTLTLNNGMTAISLDNALGGGLINFNGGGLQSADGNLRTVTNYLSISTSTTFGAPGTGNLLFTIPQVANGGLSKTLSISNNLTTISGTLTNTGPLVKAGPGILALGGSNNLSSSLGINQGTLALGAIATFTNATTITIASQATLDASASGSFALQTNELLTAGSFGGNPTPGSLSIDINGALINNGGEINIAGTGVTGYLNVNGGLTLNGGTLDYDLSDPSYSVDWDNDYIYINGPLSVTGTVVVNPPPVMPDGTYYLITSLTGSLTWGAGSAANFAVPAGRHGTYSFADDGQGDLVMNVAGASGNTEVWQGYANNVWDLSTLNWTNLPNLMSTNFSQGDNVSFDDTALVYAGSTNVSFGANVLNPTVVIISNNAAGYTFIGTNGGGKLTGNTSLIKRGPGVLTIVATNDFYGSVSIQQGLVVMGNSISGLGSPLGNTNRGTVTITNGATLDLNAAVANVPMFGGRKLVISGSGYDGNGAVINNGSQQDYNAVQNITLAGNTTIGSSNRWDIRNVTAYPTTLNTMSNAYSLTKTGVGQFSLVGVTVDPYLANVNVQAGLFSFESTSTSLGNPTNTVTMQPGTTFQIWGATNWLNKQIVLSGNSTFKDGSGANTVVGPITLNNSGAPTNIIDTTGGNLTLLGPVGGASGLTKINANTLILGATNTWSGPLNVLAGTVQFGTNGVSGSPGSGDITITNGCTLVYNVAASNVWNNNIYGTLGTLTVATNTGGLVLKGANDLVGQVNVNGGSLTLNSGNMNAGTNSLNVANGVAGQTAIFQIVSGNYTNTGQNNIGTAANSVGVINQTGGSFTTTGVMGFGNAIGEYAAYMISGGSASFGGDTQLGRGAANNGATTLFSQTGGTVNSTSWFTIARDGGIGVLDLSGGLHFRPTTAANRFYLAGNSAGGFAQVTLRGTGTLDDEDPLGFSFSSGSQANAVTGIVNLNPGGTLVEKTAFTWGNTALASVGIINFNGGTLRASGSSATYLQGWTAAYIHSAGAIIDTTNNSITIAQPLLVSSGNGVTSISASGSGFVTPPVVSLSGGGTGVGATALAQIDANGNLTSVLISNPGENYSSAPIVAFMGGGGTATGTATIGANNTSGGLTKLGGGTLTLSGANTYNGPSVVNAGVLAINGANTSGATVNATGTLTGTGSLGGSVTVNSGGSLNPGAVGAPGTLTAGSTVFSTGSSLAVDINTTTALGTGSNDLLVVNGNLTLNSGTVVNVNPIAVPIVTGTPYTIITYTGSLIGSAANLTATGLGGRYSATFAVVAGSPNAITMTLSDNGAAAYTLAWQGDGVTNQWSTAGYTNQFTNTLGWTAFHNADNVRFDDTSRNTNINFVGAVVPTTALVASSNNYTFSGYGKLSGAGAALLKTGTGTLTVNTTNDYTGGTVVSGGVLRLGSFTNATGLGLPSGNTPLCVVTNAVGMAGAALDINSEEFNLIAAYTNPIVISGSYSSNVGAIFNSGPTLAGGNGIMSLALAADATYGNSGNRFDIMGSVNGGGHNLTILGNGHAIWGGPVTNLNSLTAAGTGRTELGKTVTSLGGAVVTNLAILNLYEIAGYTALPGGVISNSTMVMSNASFTQTSPGNIWGGPIVLLPGTTNTFDDGTYTNFGVLCGISGGGALKKVDTQSLTLYSNNTYSGNTLLTAGKLIFASSATTPASPVFTVASGTVLDVSQVSGGLVLGAGQNLYGSGMISGELNVGGAGSGVSPGTNLNTAATLILSNGYPFDVNSGSTLYFDLSSSTTTGGGVNDLISMSGGALNLNGGTVFINPLTGSLPSGGQYQIISGGSPGTGSAANLTVASVVPMNQLRQTFTLDSTFAPGGLVLDVSGGSGLGGTGGSLIWQGNNGPSWDVRATLNWSNQSTMSADVFYMLDSVQFDDTGVGTVALNTALYPASILVSNNIVPYTWSGSGSITGAVSMVKAGSGLLTLNLALSNAAPTIVRDGTIRLGVPNALPNQILQLGDRTSQYGGNLDLSVASQTVTGLNVYSTNNPTPITNTITIGSGQSLTVTGDINVGPSLTNGVTQLTVSGLGTFAANAPTNTLTVVKGSSTGTVNTGVGGTVDFSALANLNLNLLNVNIGGWDNVGSFHSALILATNSSLKVTNLTVGSSSEGSQMSLLLGSGANVFNVDTFNVGTGARDFGLVQFKTPGGTFALTNTTGAGRANMNIETGTQTTGYTATNLFDVTGHPAYLYLANFIMGDQGGRTGYQTNKFAFDTGLMDVTNVIMARSVGSGHNSVSLMSIGGGTVNVGSGGFMLASNAVGYLTIYGGTVTLGADLIKAATLTIGNTGTLTLAGGTLNMQGHKIGGSIPIDVLSFQSGTLQNAGEINNGANLIMIGTNTLVLAGTNTYSGSTVVSNGTLQVNGTIGGNTVTVMTNATLGGYGTIGGPVTVQNGGTLALGTNVGILTINSTVVFQSGSTNTMKINKSNPGMTNDLVKGVSTLTYGGTLNVVVTGAAPVAGDTFMLFSAGTITGSFAATNLPALNAGLVWDTSALGSGVLRVASLGPILTSVTPNPVTGSSFLAPLTLTGSGFVAPCTVLLTNLTTLAGGSYAATFNSATSLSVSGFVGTVAGPWNATVVNSGGAPSGQVSFNVTTPAHCQISSITSLGNSVTLAGTGGVQGYTYVVTGTNDLSQPISSWIPVYTNTFGPGGSFNFTIPANLSIPMFYYIIAQ